MEIGQEIGWTVKVHGPVLRALGDKVCPDHTALIVIDMQNDFCADEGFMAENGAELRPVQTMAREITTLLQSARKARVLVVFVRNTYSTQANWYLSAPWLEAASRRYNGQAHTKRDVCRPNSWNAEFYSDVRPLPEEPIVTKHRYSAFYNTELDLILRTHGIRTVVIAGVATNVCVETTVREAFVRDYYVVVPRETTAAYSRKEYDAALHNIDMYFAQVTGAEELTKLWDQMQASDPRDAGRRDLKPRSDGSEASPRLTRGQSLETRDAQCGGAGTA